MDKDKYEQIKVNRRKEFWIENFILSAYISLVAFEVLVVTYIFDNKIGLNEMLTKIVVAIFIIQMIIMLIIGTIAYITELIK